VAGLALILGIDRFMSEARALTNLIGDGVATDLSSSGIGIRGNQSVTPGMEVSLIIDLPGMEKPFCIPRSRVSWVEGCRFGVEMEILTLEEKNHLRLFL